MPISAIKNVLFIFNFLAKLMMKTNIRNLLKGPIFSIITPFNKSQFIDYQSLKKYILYLYRNGARVFYLMVYNSRFGLLDEKEIIKLNLFCIKTVKKLDKKNIIITAEPYHCSTNKSIKLVNLFAISPEDMISAAIIKNGMASKVE